MTELASQDPDHRSGIVLVTALCVTAVVLSAVLRWTDSDAFLPYFGGANPTLMISLASVVGAVALVTLQKHRWFAIHGDTRRGLLTAARAAVLLALPVIAVDFLGGFEEGINVLPPESLLFYPAIAVVAEFVFHVTPLAAIALLATGVRVDPERARWPAIVVVAMIEPAVQVVWGSGHSPVWATAYVGVHVFAFNLIGLHLFRRYGFITMLALRGVYYLLWHVLWGSARLMLLFG